MARNAIDIVADAKRKIDKERGNARFASRPFENANLALQYVAPENYGGNNKSEWIRRLAKAAALILCEIETIQAIKGDGIL